MYTSFFKSVASCTFHCSSFTIESTELKQKRAAPPPGGATLEVYDSVLQVHQGAGLGTAIHDVLILDAQQVALGDHDIDVPHQAGDTVQIQTVLQLHL